MAKIKHEKASVKKAAKPVKAKTEKKTVRAAKPKSAIKKSALRVAAKPVKKAVVKPQKKFVATPQPKVIIPPAEIKPVKTEKPPIVQPKVIIPPRPEKRFTPAVAPAEAKPLKADKPLVVPPPSKPVIKPVIPEVKSIEPAVMAPELKELELALPITLKDLSVRLQEKPSALIKILMDKRVMVGINQLLDEQSVQFICAKFGYKVKEAPGEEEIALKFHQQVDSPELLKPRSPIVTFMGHVDHGKTSLLDAIRKSKVAELEHGGITQHIGAYRVKLPKGAITFLDTPGHEAFTAMRARGASVTDIVVLVVAADDGIMPQTKEAIDHARAAGVPIVVAANKIDKPQANLDRVKKQLSELDLAAEDWGGKTIVAGVSAKTGEGIDNLLEMILLEAEMLELKSNPDKHASGVVIEAKLSKGRGPVATLLVRQGTLHLNENIIVGNFYGKIRAMFDDHGHSVTEAGPSFPVEILGVSGLPPAGEPFFVIPDERIAKDLALKRQEASKQQQVKSVKRISLEDLHSQIKEGKLKELKIILKADVQGSLEAIKDTLLKLNIAEINAEIKMEIIHDGVGNINSSDVVLAVASNALILGFNVVADDLAKDLINKEGVDVKIYNIIYELADDIKAALEGMLAPRLKKIFIGKAEVRKVFKLSRSGIIAGSFVLKGKITRNVQVSIIRNGSPVFEGKLASLKRFKDDVREVAEGFECGIAVTGYDQLMEGDVIEAYDLEKIARKL